MKAKTELRNENGELYGIEFKCACGCFVASYLADTSCDNCGRDYNAFGQELAPRSQWDEHGDY